MFTRRVTASTFSDLCQCKTTIPMFVGTNHSCSNRKAKSSCGAGMPNKPLQYTIRHMAGMRASILFPILPGTVPATQAEGIGSLEPDLWTLTFLRLGLDSVLIKDASRGSKL